MNEKFLKLYAAATSSSCETTLQELIDSLELGETGFVLEQIEEVRQRLSALSLELAPGLTSGDLTSYRILRSSSRRLHDTESVQAEIALGESSHREFKSSLFYDVKRAEAVPTTPLEQLKSTEVLRSSLKTVAAFLTCGGGTLFLGVTDSASCCGIERDFLLMKGGNADVWESELRSNIVGKFEGGVAVNDYVELTFIQASGLTVARLEVQGRRKLSFIRGKDGAFGLYRRQGNRSVAVPINEIEEFLQFRLQKGWTASRPLE